MKGQNTHYKLFLFEQHNLKVVTPIVLGIKYYLDPVKN